ncbi:glycosyl hydrolase family 43 protein [Coniella lustricola]|uniref:Glycosyl hydrolase family 43 protein n=1 Tax=Coniella lustricola TaxID=2025994 RepID=A0A2T2ZX95_9PEZI|nr:glycosyl hydrolase family 43 protein [Coniella lustricola]
MARHSVFTKLGLVASLAGVVLAWPLESSEASGWDGKWYSFATNGSGFNIQVAQASSPDGPWTWLDHDALPNSGSWTTNNNAWAPDVKRMPPASQSLFIMAYSGQLASNPDHHCVGIATSHSITGPYTPGNSPLICPDILTTGGAIDPSLYYDERNNKRYLVYKVDGSNLDVNGGCGSPGGTIHPTPIMLQEMNVNDWTTPVGDPVQILDRTAADGTLIEAPYIIGTSDGHYILFYSSNCFTDPTYDVKYAVATSITGPYTRRGSLLTTGSYGLASPGGASSTPGGDVLVFHANCTVGRCLHTIDMSISGGVVTLKG